MVTGSIHNSFNDDMVDEPHVSPLGGRTTRKDEKVDLSSDGETTWTNTRGTGSGNGAGQYRITWRRHAQAFAQTWDTIYTTE